MEFWQAGVRFINYYFEIVLIKPMKCLYGGQMTDFYEIIERARKTGKIEKGTNEVIKAIERGTAKAVFYAADVSPKEITAILPPLCKEKGILCVEVDSKQKLGLAAGIKVNTASIAVITAGSAEKDIAHLIKK